MNATEPKRRVVGSWLAGLVVGCLGCVLGVVAGLSALLLIGAATWDGNAMAFGFGMLLGGLPAAGIGAAVGIWAALRFLRAIRDSSISGKQRRKRISIAVAASGCVLMLPWLASASFQRTKEPPSDASMLANFRAHERSFDRVIAMAAKDTELTRVDVDWTDPSEPLTIGVSQDRIEAYRKLLAEANVPRGFHSLPELGETDFLYWGIGSAVSDDFTKGYAYLKKPPTHTTTRLDGLELDGVGRQVVYLRIKGNWYLYLELVPD